MFFIYLSRVRHPFALWYIMAVSKHSAISYFFENRQNRLIIPVQLFSYPFNSMLTVSAKTVCACKTNKNANTPKTIFLFIIFFSLAFDAKTYKKPVFLHTRKANQRFDGVFPISFKYLV